MGLIRQCADICWVVNRDPGRKLPRILKDSASRLDDGCRWKFFWKLRVEVVRASSSPPRVEHLLHNSINRILHYFLTLTTYTTNSEAPHVDKRHAIGFQDSRPYLQRLLELILRVKSEQWSSSPNFMFFMRSTLLTPVPQARFLPQRLTSRHIGSQPWPNKGSCLLFLSMASNA